MAARGSDWLPLIRRLASRPDAEPDTDADLLGRFVQDRDEAAFAALVRRHGGLVLSVCRRVLQDPHEAEDVAQATWLVLARKAAALRRPQTLAAWLHGVARRLALNARRAGQRRRRREGDGGQTTPAAARADPLDVLTARELLLALDEEVQRLPKVYRLPVILCCLEGISQEEAAARLGWTVGSCKGRLERGRRRLQACLARRGLGLAAVLGLVEAARTAAAVKEREMAQVAMAYTAGEAVPSEAVALAESALRGVAGLKLKAGLLLTVVLAAAVAAKMALPRVREQPPRDPCRITSPCFASERHSCGGSPDRCRRPTECRAA